MAIIAQNTDTNTVLAPAGNHIARCYSMVHIGTLDDEYMGQPRKTNKVRLTWELPNEKHIFREENGPEPFVVSKEYTLSMGEKSNLRKDLESWRGKAFSEDEAKAFDVTVLTGVPCMINVIHKDSSTGKTHARVTGVTPLPKGIDCPEQINPSFEFNFDEGFENLESLPDWLKDKIKSSYEFKSKMGITQAEDIKSTEDEDDDLPF